ncbi:hypothetical protein Tco_0024043 [Tanacetum coccineum]
MLSVKEANRGSRGLREIGSSSEGHPPKQPVEYPERNGVKVINMIRQEGNRKRSFEERRGNISSPRSNRSSSNFGKGRKKQDNANGVCNNKMLFAVQHHNRKDRNEKPRSSSIRMQTPGKSTRIVEGGPTLDPMSLERTWGRENGEEAFTIIHELSDQYVTTGTTLTTNCKIYPVAKPVVHKRRPMASEGRLALKEKVFHWLKEGLIRKRMMEKVLADQRGHNVETYLEEIVIKSKSEMDLVQDVKETLRKLKRVNIKIDPTMSSFGVKEGRFLGHIVVEKRLRTDPGRIQEIILSPTPRIPNQIRSLFLQLTAISKFIPKLADLKHPIREARTRMVKAKESG